MLKRSVDICASAACLLLLMPILVLIGCCIRLASPGPVLFRTWRLGRGGRPFLMHKFRTMDRRRERGSAITAAGDTRVFGFGRILRRTKLDELPQLWDVLRGEMSIIGPRPEDLGIVVRHYAPWMHTTLSVAPGISSLGSIYNYTHGERLLTGADVEVEYAVRVLPIRLALEVVYLRRCSLGYDFRIAARTVAVIASMALGMRTFREPVEIAEARAVLGELGVPGLEAQR